jgi:hypothetical protein
MENKKVLDQYLYSLEKSLSDLNPSDRAKIVLDINEHIHEACEKYEDKKLKEILEDLGHPQKVANHYRLDRGLKTFKPDKHPIIKWLSISFMGSVIAFLLFIIIIVWKFTPIFEIDEKKGRVVLLGGLIDLNSTSGKMKIMDQYHFVDNQFANQFDGAVDFPKEEYDEVIVNFKSGVLNFKTSLEEKLSWNCKLDNPPTSEFLNRTKDTVELDFEEFSGIACDIFIPAEAKLTVDGKDAQITVNDAEFDTFIEIENGQVAFNPNPEVDYSYDLKVKEGTSTNFENSNAKDAFETRIYIENGSISKSN